MERHTSKRSKITLEIANRKDSTLPLEVSVLPSRVVSVLRRHEDNSEVMTNGFRLRTFINTYSGALRADVPVEV